MLAIVPAGTNGAVSVYVTNTTHVIIDIDGYFMNGEDHGSLLSAGPCRILTRVTRTSPQALDTDLAWTGGSPRPAQCWTSRCLNGVNSPKAYSLNLTVSAACARAAAGISDRVAGRASSSRWSRR